MSTIALRLSALVTTILLAGCTTTSASPFPGRWNALDPQVKLDFDALNGWYQDAGEIGADSPARASLTMELFGFGAPWSKAERVLIHADGDKMRVEVWGSEGQLYAKDFSTASGDYLVDKANISIATQGKAVGEGFIGAFAAGVQLFTQPGQLLVHEKSEYRGSGIFHLQNGSTDQWYRFQKLPDAP